MNAAAATVRLTCAAGLQSRRRRVLLIFVLALLLLALATAMFVTTHQHTLQAELELTQARQMLMDARHHEDVVGQQVALHQALVDLDQHARRLGLAPQQWSERRVNLHQQAMPREAANDILLGTGRGNGRLFAVDAFDLSVTRPDESLFELPVGNSLPLRMTLSGTALFGTRGTP